MPLNLTFDDADQDLVNMWELTDGTSLDTPAIASVPQMSLESSNVDSVACHEFL